MTTGRLFIDQPPIIFSGRVNQTDFTYPLAAVDFDGGIGSGVAVGQTVVFGTAIGLSDRGRQRVRAGSTIGVTGTLHFGRSSRGVLDGEVDLEDDIYFAIFDDRRIWAIAPNEEGFPTYKDHDIAVGDYMTESPPVANIGGPGDAGFAATGVGSPEVCSVTLSGAGSFATASGASLVTYLWDVDDGAITSGTTGSETITVTFPVGFRYVTLTVTDSNGQSHTQSYPVYVRTGGEADGTIVHQVESRIRRADGQEIAFRILEDLPALTYPPGMLVMYWEGEPSGPTDRSHMQFVGWHVADAESIEALRTGAVADTVLRCVDAAGRLKTLPGFPQIIGRTEDGYADWSAAPAGNRHMDWYLHYLLHWHSTALDVVYWTWSGTTTDYPFVVLGSDGESLFEQVNRKCNSLVPDHHLTCSRQGALQVVVDPMVQDTADRTATVQTTLTEAKWVDVRHETEVTPRIHWLWGDAIQASVAPPINALFCVAPGTAPGQGLSPQDHGEQLAQSQSDLNINEGHRYARLNAPQRAFQVTLANSADANSIEPADMEWVGLTIGATYAARRGLTLSSGRGQPLEVSYQYDYRREGVTVTAELLWERETVGMPATTYIPPVGSGWDDDDWDIPPITPPPPTQGTGMGRAYRMVGNTLGRTNDLSASSPSWSAIATAIELAAGTFRDFQLHPWYPSNVAYLLTDIGVFRTSNIEGASPSWDHILDLATITAGVGGAPDSMRKFMGSINIEGFFCFVVRRGNTVWLARSYTQGDSWTFHLVVSGGSQYGIPVDAGDLLMHTPGGQPVIAVVYRYLISTVSGYSARILKSVDGGVTWVDTGFPRNAFASTSGAFFVSFPYFGNENGMEIWGHTHTGGGTRNRLARTVVGGAPWTVVRTDVGDRSFRGVFGAHIFDNSKIWHWTGNNTLNLSDNYGADWTTAANAGLSGVVAGAGGFPFIGDQYYASTSAGLFVSTNRGASWLDKTGNWSWGHDGNAHVIVVDWTE